LAKINYRPYPFRERRIGLRQFEAVAIPISW